MVKLTRQQFLRGAAASAIAFAVSPTIARNVRRPNVLVVLVDEWRAEAFGHRGDPNAVTPAIDAFAKQAIDFQQAVSGSPVCCPARASLMTGQYPLTHGVYVNDVPLKPKGVTLGEAFAKAGYRTGYIGKWHLYGSPQGVYERRLVNVPPEARMGFQYWKAGECTHNYNKSLYFANDDPTPRYWPGFDSVPQTEDAEQFIRDNAKGKDPYFLVLSWGPPHFPYMPPADYAARWANKDIKLRDNVPEADRAAATTELRGYYAQAEVLDDCFKRLLAAIEESGTADDTIVLFTSDHGEMAFSQGIKYKNVPWDEAVRVPFLLRYPKAFGRQNLKLDAPLNTPDIMPTLLSLAGVKVPSGVEGHDWSSTIKRPRAAARPQSAFLSLPASFGTMRNYGIAEFRGVRTPQHTYVRSIHGPWLLYDNLKDPLQQTNLIGRPEAKAIQARMEADLNAHLRRRHDAFRPGIDYLRRDGLTHFVEVMLPIGEKTGPNGQWHSTLKEGEPNSIPSDPKASSRLHRDL